LCTVDGARRQGHRRSAEAPVRALDGGAHDAGSVAMMHGAWSGLSIGLGTVAFAERANSCIPLIAGAHIIYSNDMRRIHCIIPFYGPPMSHLGTLTKQGADSNGWINHDGCMGLRLAPPS
jgi:hypothetical protein